jgi:hypothetical protein
MNVTKKGKEVKFCIYLYSFTLLKEKLRVLVE